MRWKSELKLQTLMLLVLMPCLLLATAAFGWMIYEEMYQIIIRGFDAKLRATSTVTGAFVRGVDHDTILKVRHLNSLIYDPVSRNLFGIDSTTQEMLTVNTMRGAAYVPTKADSQRIAVLPPRSGIFAVDGRDHLLRIEGGVQDIGPILLEEEPADSTEPPKRTPLPVAAVAFDSINRVLYGAADGLVLIDTATAIARRGDLMNGFRNELAPQYYKYVIPFRRIMRKKDITYLYTQLLSLGGHIVYGLDGTVGEEHSPVGSEDELPKEELGGTERVLTDDSVHLSGIRHWEQWGLLKSAFAPIYWPNGEIKGMAGADVNISTIAEKTRFALAQVGLVAALILVLAGWVSYRMSRKLSEPLADVKNGALRVAAGEYGYQLPPKDIDEVQDLADSFNRMSTRMRWTLEELTETNRGLELVRRRRELETVLAENVAGPARGSCVRVNWLGEGKVRDSSGCVAVPGNADLALAWLCDAGANPVAALRTRKEIETIALRLLARGDAPGDVADRMMSLYPDSMFCVLLLDARTGAVEARTRRSTVAVMQHEGGSRSLDLASVPKLQVDGGEIFTVTSDGSPAKTNGHSNGGDPARPERERLVLTFTSATGVLPKEFWNS